jgi:glyoxylase-like metal-dependent hydrolase (beta-lactamase superfamily II)
MYDSRDKILFSGDTVFPEGSFGRTDLGGDDEELVKSLERLTRLEVRFMLPGHMRPITRNVKLQIQTSYQNALTWL